MTSEQRLQLSRGMSAERLVLLLLIPLVSSQSAKCKCPKIPPKNFTVPEDRRFEAWYRYECIPGYRRKPGTFGLIRCQERNGVSQWEQSTFECITDPKYRPPPTTTKGHQLIVGPGQDVTLPCLVPRVEHPSVALRWTRTDGLLDLYMVFTGHEVLFLRDNQEAFRGRLELREPSSMDGDFSLTLQNVNINDTGGYECMVRYFNSGGDGIKFTRSIFLNVSETENKTSSSHETWSSYLKENQFIIITVSFSLVCVVLLLGIMFLIIRYKTSLGFSKLRLSQRSRELSQSKDNGPDF